MRVLLWSVLVLGAGGFAKAQDIIPAVVQAPADIRVPVDLSSGRPAVMARIAGGEPIAVEFDTGSQGALIPRELVNKLGLKENGEVQLGSPFGGKPTIAKTVSLGTLDIGGITATDVTAVVQEDASFMGPDARLVIGPAQFADKVVALDYQARTLRIARQIDVAGPRWQPLKNGLLETDLVLAGKHIPLHIDTGNPGTLLLPQAMAEKLSPKPDLREVGRARTVDKEFTIYAGSVNRDATLAGVPVRLGDITFADVPSANLGSQGLAQFTVIVDFGRQRWQLVAPKGVTPLMTARQTMSRPQ